MGKLINYTLAGLTLAFATSLAPLKAQEQTNSSQESHLDSSVRTELIDSLPENFEDYTGREFPDIEIVTDSIEEIRENSREQAIAFFNSAEDRMHIGILSRDKAESKKELDKIIAEEFDSTAHETGHADKQLRNNELSNLYENVDIESQIDKYSFLSFLPRTNTIHSSQSTQLQNLIEVDTALSELYAIMFAKGFEEYLTRDNELLREKVFQSNLVNYLGHSTMSINRSDFYSTPECLGLLLTSQFNYDLKRTSEYIRESEPKELVETLLEPLKQTSTEGSSKSILENLLVSYGGNKKTVESKLKQMLSDTLEGISERYDISCEKVKENLQEDDSLSMAIYSGLNMLNEFSKGHFDLDYDNRKFSAKVNNEERVNLDSPHLQDYFNEMIKVIGPFMDSQESNPEMFKTMSQVSEKFSEKETPFKEAFKEDAMDFAKFSFESSPSKESADHFLNQFIDYYENFSQPSLKMLDATSRLMPSVYSALLEGDRDLNEITTVLDSYIRDWIPHSIAKREFDGSNDKTINTLFEENEEYCKKLSLTKYYLNDLSYELKMLEASYFANNGNKELALEKLSEYEQEIRKFGDYEIKSDHVDILQRQIPQKLNGLTFQKAFIHDASGDHSKALSLYKSVLGSDHGSMGNILEYDLSTFYESWKDNHPDEDPGRFISPRKFLRWRAGYLEYKMD